MFVAAAYVRTESARCYGVVPYHLNIANVEDCKTECDARGPSCVAIEFWSRRLRCYFWEQCVIELDTPDWDVYMKEGLLF